MRPGEEGRTHRTMGERRFSVAPLVANRPSWAVRGGGSWPGAYSLAFRGKFFRQSPVTIRLAPGERFLSLFVSADPMRAQGFWRRFVSKRQSRRQKGTGRSPVGGGRRAGSPAVFLRRVSNYGASGTGWSLGLLARLNAAAVGAGRPQLIVGRFLLAGLKFGPRQGWKLPTASGPDSFRKKKNKDQGI